MSPRVHAVRTWGVCAGVFALSAAFSFVPWLHAIGLYQRDGVRGGQWWRIVTAMWVHLDAWHWLADCMAATGLILLLSRVLRPDAIVGALVACGVLVQLALLNQPTVRGMAACRAHCTGWRHGVGCGCCDPLRKARLTTGAHAGSAPCCARVCW